MLFITIDGQLRLARPGDGHRLAKLQVAARQRDGAGIREIEGDRITGVCRCKSLPQRSGAAIVCIGNGQRGGEGRNSARQRQ
jgi:hypothetical protein